MILSPLTRLALVAAWAACSTAVSALAQDDVPKAPTRAKGFAHRQFVDGDGTKLHYWLLQPEAFSTKEAGGKSKYPLVLCLHGRGGNTGAATVLAGESFRKKYPCFVVAPAVTRRERWAVPDSFQRLRGKDALPRVLKLVDRLVKDLPVDADRVYVTGQSMGGFGSFGAIAARPGLFAAAIPICGGWDPADAKKFAHVAVWVFHGAEDPTVDPELSRAMVAALKEAGGTPKHTEYPGVRHNSWSRTYASAKTWAWLFAQRRGDDTPQRSNE